MPPSLDPQNTPPSSPPPLNPALVDKEADDLMEPDEQLVVIVRRHPIGLVLIYLESLIGVIALAALLIFVAPSSFRDLSSETNRLLIGGVIFAVAVLIFFLFVATYVYRQSRLLVTNKSLVQVLQKSLFSRNTSRLSMSNVEDVTAAQNGILPSMFNFGTLTIQTAGQEDNFIFPTCPDPNKYAHQILEARQAYAKSLEEGIEKRVAQ